MRFLLFPLFLLGLGFNLTLFLIKIFLASFSWSLSLLLSICVVIFQILFFLDQRWSIRQNIYQAAMETFYQEQYQQRLTVLEVEWLKILKQQPSDRDVLINLSLISGELGKTIEQEQYRARAQQIDPNFQY